MGNLSPEDIQLMKQAIDDAEAGEKGGRDEPEMHTVVEAIKYIAEQLEVIKDRLDKLESVVMDDIVGGITNLYNTNKRTSSIGNLKAKYGSAFDPHKNALDAFYPGMDIYERLQDMLDEAQGQEGFSEEGFDGSVQEAIKELEAKIAGLTGKGKVDAAEEVPAEVTIEKTEVPVEPKSDIEKAMDKFKVMRAKAPKGLQN